MSHYDYTKSREIVDQDPPSASRAFMAAMRKADSSNTAKLRAMWFDTWDELMARYDAPGGVLPGKASTMSDEYTPTMDEVRQGYVYGAAQLPAYYSKEHSVALQVHGEQFDRWLAKHDKALRRMWTQEATEDVIIHDEDLEKALREQIAESLLDDSPDGIFAAAYVRLMDPQPGDTPVRTFMRVMDIIAARIARGRANR